MLERIALHENLAEWHPSHKASNRRRQSGRKSQDRINVLTARFRNALKKSVEGVIEAGRVLIGPRANSSTVSLPHWVVRDACIWHRKDGSRPADLRKAQILMFLARNEVISNACHWHAFPPTADAVGADADTTQAATARIDRKWYDQLWDDPRGSRRTQAQDLAGTISTLKLKREIAALLEVCIVLGGGDGVLAHIRDLKDVDNLPPAKEFDRAARWARQKLAERRQSE